jgi:hypothetical protein
MMVGYGGWYSRNWGVGVAGPTTIREYDVFAAETSLVEVATDGIEWTVRTRSTAGSDIAADVRDFVDAILGEMTAAGLVPAAAPRAEAAEVSGAPMRWHRVELRFQGPSAGETGSSPNPFLDYRLQCRFTGPSGQVYDVPGFFDTNGAGASSGNLWKCRFAPDQTGSWSYVASFRSGTQIAVSLSATAGAAVSFNGDSGTFSVAESDKAGADFRAPARGMIVNDGATISCSAAAAVCGSRAARTFRRTFSVTPASTTRRTPATTSPGT